MLTRTDILIWTLISKYPLMYLLLNKFKAILHGFHGGPTANNREFSNMQEKRYQATYLTMYIFRLNYNSNIEKHFYHKNLVAQTQFCCDELAKFNHSHYKIFQTPTWQVYYCSLITRKKWSEVKPALSKSKNSNSMTYYDS